VIGQWCGGGHADEGADQHSTHYHALQGRTQRKGLLDEEQGAGDDARVIAEQKASQGGQKGGQVDDAAVRLLGLSHVSSRSEPQGKPSEAIDQAQTVIDEIIAAAVAADADVVEDGQPA